MTKEFLSEYKIEGKDKFISDPPINEASKKLICPVCGISLATLQYYSCSKEKCPVFHSPGTL